MSTSQSKYIDLKAIYKNVCVASHTHHELNATNCCTIFLPGGEGDSVVYLFKHLQNVKYVCMRQTIYMHRITHKMHNTRHPIQFLRLIGK